MSETWENILDSPTPNAWIKRALGSLETLLIDHAQCEKKAASSALSLIHRYPHYNLAKILSPLAREELLHFEQVLKLIEKQGFKYRNIKSSKYAQTLYDTSSLQEPQRLKDTLIISSIIEARSCERFFSLAPHLPHTLKKFYTKLYKAEARHCDLYLNIYSEIFNEDWSDRLSELAFIESEFINKKDDLFRFHSGY
tara:strand:+ start:2820 stop:3407 length:588 start_codon:yes stop_codon:yes gene_type:complete